MKSFLERYKTRVEELENINNNLKEKNEDLSKEIVALKEEI